MFPKWPKKNEIYGCCWGVSEGIRETHNGGSVYRDGYDVGSFLDSVCCGCFGWLGMETQMGKLGRGQ